ncbi:unnamed protein product [Anisakis simplex]|uniref:Uncharacterized protein n=1 Tax=Anisakis simplex TaxID=6269 RepID=A0A0M3JS95_ANISI|nr:unnamed protein product [Anisakis simplex]
MLIERAESRENKKERTVKRVERVLEEHWLRGEKDKTVARKSDEARGELGEAISWPEGFWRCREWETLEWDSGASVETFTGLGVEKEWMCCGNGMELLACLLPTCKYLTTIHPSIQPSIHRHRQQRRCIVFVRL